MIAEKRESKALFQWLDTGTLEEPQMDIGIAYAKLGIDDRTIDDELVLSAYEIAIMDNPSKAEDLNKAINRIAMTRESSSLRQRLHGGGLPTEPASQDWPVGLENIGNTCYLNSLLQYLFTVPELRNLVLNFDDVRMDLDSSAVASKRVGARHVSVGEIDRAQKCECLLICWRYTANLYSCL